LGSIVRDEQKSFDEIVSAVCSSNSISRPQLLGASLNWQICVAADLTRIFVKYLCANIMATSYIENMHPD
jgi:hypothetical protein